MTNPTPWWKGARGEWYVIAQVVLFALVIFGPPSWAGALDWSSPFAELAYIVGGLLILAGFLLAAAGIWRLGANLTPLPYPKDQGTLIETGPYRLVRHPIYSGAIFMACGWGLWVHGLLTIGYAIILFAFFDVKSRREEQWLKEKYPDYKAYQKRVRKLIPFVY